MTTTSFDGLLRPHDAFAPAEVVHCSVTVLPTTVNAAKELPVATTARSARPGAEPRSERQHADRAAAAAAREDAGGEVTRAHGRSL
ncbi:MAG TPA: hypothetical protein VNG89_19980 [Vicinamibacterales bacterium]|nr:hypothetical protein [Vicinamibacterales bacterium]